MDRDDNDHLTQQYPAWRDAVRTFFRQEFKPGDLLTFDWLYVNFAVERPGKTTMMDDANKAKTAFLHQFQNFEDALLREHQIALENIRGEGYRVVPPSEQTDWAERQGIGEIKRAIRKLVDRESNVDLTALTPEQRRQNADGLARAAMLGNMLGRAIAPNHPRLLDDDE